MNPALKETRAGVARRRGEHETGREPQQRGDRDAPLVMRSGDLQKRRR